MIIYASFELIHKRLLDHLVNKRDPEVIKRNQSVIILDGAHFLPSPLIRKGKRVVITLRNNKNSSRPITTCSSSLIGAPIAKDMSRIELGIEQQYPMKCRRNLAMAPR